MRIQLLSILLALTVISAAGQKTERDKPALENWLLNAPSAPLIFDYKPIDDPVYEQRYKRQYWLGLRNRSTKNIESFWLGCVVITKEDNVRLLRKVSESHINHNGYPPAKFQDFIFDSSDPDEDENEAKKFCKEAKLAVIKVGFTDGEMWLLPSEESK